MPNKNRIMKVMLAIALLPLLLLSTQAFGQSASSISGAVMDTSQAVLPGSSITATNTETGITSKTVANSAGVYNFPSLQPGVYQVIAEMNGFQKATKTDVKLGMGNQVRLNFELVVAGVATEVEVTTSAENLMLEQGSSTGTVLPENIITQLPLASNDVMDLINVMGGVVKQEDPIFGASNQTFAGVTVGNINIQRDGVTVNEVRYTSGIVSPSRINQEMVGEFKMVLSPVDAEMGRGAGQVQILTKSGANTFHGSAVWNNQNTALDANEFSRNVTGTKPDWRNLNNYTLSASGPIIKNKTFFFVTWDQQIQRTKSVIAPKVMTACARLGIYRYLYEPATGSTALKAWQNGNTQTFFNGTQTSRPTVNADGTPAYSLTYQTTTPGVTATTPTATLGFESVLGKLTPEATAAVLRDPVNCSDAYLTARDPQQLVTSGSYWDTNRTQFDTTGYVARFNAMMPPANFFAKGDGLNWAGHRWVRAQHGSDTVFGSGEDNERKSITFKIDHNINQANRASGTYTYETDFGEDGPGLWPENSYGGAVDRQPTSFTISLTSTLKPTLLNEFRMGLSRTQTHTRNAAGNVKNGPKVLAILDQLMPTANFPNYSGYPLLVQAGSGNFWYGPQSGDASHPFSNRSGIIAGTWGGTDPRWSFGDTITWTRGSHSFKGGVEFRRAKSWQEANGDTTTALTYPTANGGTLSTSLFNAGAFQLAANGQTGWLGMYGNDTATSVTGNYSDAYAMLNLMAGSVGSITQYFYVNSATDKVWNDAKAGDLNQIIDIRTKEFSSFFKDDWKVNSSLTLNLGVRHEYYGVPITASGMTAALVGGSAGAFGITGGDMTTWLNPNRTQSGALTEYQFVGPGSPNPDLSPWNKDMNNFAPHVGFAWQLPWLGKGKSTLRGGYSMSYSAISNFDGYAGVIAKAAGTTYTYNYTGGGTVGTNGGTTGQYLTLADLPQLVPLVPPSNIQPLAVRPITNRSTGVTVYDDNVKNPYTQSLNLSLTRNVGSNLTVDVRYIATLARQSISGINLNTANFINNGMAARFDRVRLGTETAEDLVELRKIIGNNGTTGYLYAGQTNPAQQLRFQYTSALWQGNYNSIASSLFTTNGAIGTTFWELAPQATWFVEVVSTLESQLVKTSSVPIRSTAALRSMTTVANRITIRCRHR